MPSSTELTQELIHCRGARHRQARPSGRSGGGGAHRQQAAGWPQRRTLTGGGNQRRDRSRVHAGERRERRLQSGASRLGAAGVRLQCGAPRRARWRDTQCRHVQGGININSVPDRAVIGIDIRTIPGPPMWTNENRSKYNRDHLRYPSDLTDNEWTHVEPFIPPAKPGGGKRRTDMRAVMNGVMYILIRLPMALPSKGFSAAQHRAQLLRLVALRRHAGSNSSCALR